MYSKHNSDSARTVLCFAVASKEDSKILREMAKQHTDTFVHSINVAFLTAQVLLNYLEKSEHDMSFEKVCQITEAALLHDAGKLCINPSLLYKKDPITDEEREILKMHPIYGLKVVDYHFKPCTYAVIRDTIELHHERPDGSGYPYNLNADQIPWYVSLISTADAYEALTAERSYGKVYTREEATKKLEEEGFIKEYIYDIAKTDIN